MHNWNLPFLLSIAVLTACGHGEYSPSDYDSTTLPSDPLTEETEEEDWEICDRAIDEERTVYMSADDSNSQAQPALVRESLQNEISIWGSPRYYEFLNYYIFDFEPASAGTVRVVPQLRLVEGTEDTYTLLVGVVSETLNAEDRRPANLVFSVDTSGSMSGVPIERAQAVLHALSSQLHAGDTISMISWSDTQDVFLRSHVVDGPDDRDLKRAINRLDSGGSTDLAAGLALAYELAGEGSTAETLSRVVLISDGGANTGITEEEIIGNGAADETAEGIYLTAVGTADPGAYSGAFMDHISDLGKGAHIYVDSDAEAQAMFGTDRFLSNLEIAIRDVRLGITLPSGFVIEEFHGEEMSLDPEEVKPQHLAPNDAMLYHQQIIGCLDGEEDPLFTFEVTFQDPNTREDQVVTVHATLSEMLGAEANELAKADALVAFAKAIYGDGSVAEASDAIAAAQVQNAGDSDLAEVQSLLGEVSSR